MLPDSVSYMSKLAQAVDEAEARGLIRHSTLLLDDGMICGYLLEDADGACVVTAPRGAVTCERFQHLEDALAAAEAAGLVTYDPFSAVVPIMPRWKLD